MLHAPATPFCPDAPAVPPVAVEPPTCVAPAAPPWELEPAALDSSPPKLEPAAPESLLPELEPAAPETPLPPEPGAPPLELPQEQMTNTAAQPNTGNLQNIKVNSLTEGAPGHHVAPTYYLSAPPHDHQGSMRDACRVAAMDSALIIVRSGTAALRAIVAGYGDALLDAARDRAARARGVRTLASDRTAAACRLNAHRANRSALRD